MEQAMSDLQDTIRENAQKPAEVQVDGVRTRQHSLRDQIAADRYLSSKTAAQGQRLPIRIAKIVPPGPT